MIKALLPNFKKITSFVLFLSLLVLNNVSWGQSPVTYAMTSLGLSNATVTGTGSYSVNSNISIAFAQNSGSTAPTFYTAENGVRLYTAATPSTPYNGGSITITPSSGATITAVTLTTSSTTYTPTLRYSIGAATTTATDPTATLSSTTYTISGLSIASTSSIKIRNANTTSVQLRLTSITVTYTLPNPTLSAATLGGVLSTTYGTASAAQSATVTGSNLGSNTLTATAQTGYEVSLNGTSGWGGSVTYTPSSGSVSSTVYVRFAASKVPGTYNSNTCVVLSCSGASDANISTTSSTSNAISTKALTVTGLSTSNKVYDKTTTASLSGTGALSGIVGSDVVNLTGTPTASFASSGVANGITVTVSGYSLTGTNASYYTLTAPSFSANITAKELTISGIIANSKTYDGNTTATISGTPTLNGVVSGDELNVSVSGTPTATFSDATVGTNKPVAVSGYTLSGSAAGNYSLTQPTLSADITAASTPTLSVSGTLSALSTTYGTASSYGQFIVSGSSLTNDIVVTPPYGFEISTSSGSGYTTSLTLTQSGGTVNPTTIYIILAASTPFGSYSGNISVTSTGADPKSISITSSTVAKKGITISGVTANNKVYDAATTATLGGTATLNGVEAGDVDDVTIDASGVSASFATKTVAPGKSVTVTGYQLAGLASGNYTVSQPTGLTAEITAAPLTVTGAVAADKTYDGNTTATISNTGTLNGKQGSDVVSIASTGTFSSANAGTWTVTLTLNGTDAGNYSLTQPGITATINKADQTIIGLASTDTKYVGASSYSLSATAPGGTVTYTSSDLGVATISGSTVTIVGIGTTTITATQAGTTNYNSATATQTLTVTAAPTISIAPTSLAAFSTTTGTASVAQAFNVSGTNLAANITVTPPSGYEVSTTSATTGFASTQTLTQSGGTVSSTTVYVRLTSVASAGTYNGNVAMTSTGATTVNMAVNGTVSAAASATLIAGWDFQTTTNGGTASANNPNTPVLFTANFGTGTLYLDGSNGSSTFTQSTELDAFAGTSNINVGSGFSTITTAPATLSVIAPTGLTSNGKSIVFKFNMTGYKDLAVSYASRVSNASNAFTTNTWEYSTNGTSWSSLQTITGFTTAYAAYSLTSTSVLNNISTAYLRLTFSGATSASSNQRLDNIQLNATPITASIAAGGGPITSLSTTAGTPSSATSFTLTGSGLSSTISLAALAGFEYATAVGGPYTSTLTGVSATGPTTIYVRLAAANSVGTYSGNIVCSSGATTLNVPMPSSTVSKGSQTITFASTNTKTYGDADFAPGATVNSGLTISYTSSNTAVATIVSGNIHIVGAGTTTITASQAGNSDFFAATDATQTLTVNKANQTITFASTNTKTYGDADYAPGATSATSGVNAITYSSSNTAVATIVSGNIHIVGAGTTTITASQASDANYNAGSATQTLTVNQKGLTITGITADNKYYDGNTTATLSGTAVLNGVVSGDESNVSLSGTPVATFATASVGTAITVTVSGYTLSGTSAANYSLTQPTLSADIIALTPTIFASGTLSAVSTTYGTASATPTSFTVSGQSMEAGILVTPPSGYEVSTSVGSGYASTITVGAAGTISSTTVYVRLSATATVSGSPYSGNIVLSSLDAVNVNVATASSTIAQKTLTISGLTGVDKVYDGTTSASVSGTATLNGVVNSDDVTLGGTPSYSFATAAVGSNKPITVTGYTISGAGAGNYSLTQPTGLTASISKADQTITALTTPLTKTFGDATYSVATTATSGLTVTYASSNTAVATVTTNGTVTIVGAGTATITASQAGNSNYNAAPDVTQALTVNKANQTITALTTPLTKTFGDATYSVATTATSGLTVTYSSSNTAVATVAANGTVTIVGAGTATITAAQAGNTNYNAATSVTQALTVNKANQTITGLAATDSKTTATTTYSLTATAPGGTVTYTSSNTAVATISGSTVTIVGTGTTTITASQAGSANYNAAPDVTQTLTVTPPVVSLGQYQFTSSLAVSSPNANLTYTDVSPNSVTGTTTSNYYNLSLSPDWGTDFNANAYIQFTVSPSSGKLLTVSNLTFLQLRTAAGANNFVVRSSADGYSTNLGSGVYTTTSGSGSPSTSATVSLSGTSFTDVIGSLTFRIYPYGIVGAGTGNWRIDNLTVNGFVTSCSGTVPVISTQPSAQTVCSGSSISLSVSASPATAYQWRKDGVNISGANSATYTVSSATSANAGSYDVIITGSTSCAITTSNAAVVTVNEAPTSVAISPTSATICNGSVQQLTATSTYLATDGVGTGTSTTSAAVNTSALGPNPFQNYYGGAKQHMLVAASTLNSMGLSTGSVISSMQLQMAVADQTYALQNLKVKMQNTAISAVSTTAMVTTGWTTVYTAASYTPSAGYTNLPFTSNFTWDGTSNLLVEILYSNANAGATTATNTAYYSTTSFVSTAYYRIDNVDDATIESYAAAPSFTYSTRNNIKFVFTKPTPITWSPTTDLYTTVGATSSYTGDARATVFAKPSSAITYTATASINGCTKTNTVSIAVNSLPTASVSTSVSTICSGVNAVFTLNGTSGAVVTYNLNGGSDQTAMLTGGTATVTVTAATSTQTLNLVSVNNPSTGCSVTLSGNATVTVTSAGYVWTGAVDNDFNNSGNWQCGVVPPTGTGADVSVSAGETLPLSSSVTLGDITLGAGSSINLQGFHLTLSGSVNGTLLLSGSTNSSLTFSGSGNPTVNFTSGTGSLSQLNVLSDLVLGSTLAVYTKVTVGSGATLTTNDLLTLKSSITSTAYVGQSAGTITGNVGVERYIRQNTSRGWRMLAVPIQSSQSIKASWQEGATSYVDNPRPGYGTRITANTATAVADGYDAQTFGNSLLSYNAGPTPTWSGVTSNLSTTNIATTGGWMIYIRGDRTVDTAQTITAPSATILETKGTLYQGDQTVNTVNGFNIVGNLYASEVDFTQLSRDAVNNTFYLWDPKLAGSYGLGGFQTFSAPDWMPTPGGGSYGSAANTKIQSGLAFLVYSNGAGSVGFSESAKTTGSNGSATGFRPSLADSYLSTNLYAVTSGTPSLADGNRVFFDVSFSNDLDSYDNEKAAGFGEGIGMLRSSKVLQTERRQPVVDGDYIAYNLSGLKSTTGTFKYRLEFAPVTMNTGTIKAFLEDAYLKTSKAIDLSTTNSVDFTVVSSNAATYANRFKLVFRETGTVPVRFTSVKATQVSQSVKVEWSVSNEQGISRYEVERSSNGSSFTKLGTTGSTSSVNYSYMDNSPLMGVNYYRVRSIGENGSSSYTYIVKVVNGKVVSSITITGNVIKGGMVGLQFNNQIKGDYVVKVLNTVGQELHKSRISHTGGNAGYSVTIPGVVKGLYHVDVQTPDNEHKVFKVVVE